MPRRWGRGPQLARSTAMAAAGAAAMEAPPGVLGWLGLLWPFPAVISSTFLIAWASEVAAFFVSRGMALALLALLQVLPEFAVEAVLAANAALDPAQLPYVTANFTGANRILVGLALPLIFLLTWRVRKRSGTWKGAMYLGRENSVEVIFLLLPSLYSLTFWFTHRISIVDTVVLLAMYAAYLLVLYHMPVAGAEEAERLRGVAARVMRRSRRFQGGFAVGAFLAGGFVLYETVEPFVHNMQVIAFAVGISAYLVVQYIAPILSEFPEFLTTTYFARLGRGEEAFTNVVSAKINQWTLLVGMIPIVFAVTNFTAGHGTTFLPLDRHQSVEVLLTTAQGLFAVACLLKLRFLLWEAAALLFLWAFQAVDFVTDPLLAGVLPSILGTPAVVREWVTVVFFALVVVEVVRYGREWAAFDAFRGVWRKHVRPRAA
jgi:cation:H+ antiporter